MSSHSRSYSRSKSRGRRSYETKSPSRSRSRDRKRRRRSVSSRRSRSASGSRGRGSPQRGGRRGGANKISQNKLDSLARQHDDGGKKVYIGNLSSRCHERDLEEVFGSYGEIEDVYIPRDKSTWLGKGFAFVTFAKIEPAIEASESWDQKRFMGRRIAVNLARPRPNARNSSPTGGRIRTYVPSRDDSSERDRRRQTRSYSR